MCIVYRNVFYTVVKIKLIDKRTHNITTLKLRNIIIQFKTIHTVS